MKKRETVLVVEDNPITRKMVRVTLEQAGYRVEQAADAQTALARFEQRPPDLVIQDIVLPDMDGAELLRAFRAAPGGTKIPIIAFSAFSRWEHPPDAGDGFTDYLFKPIEPSAILEMVQAHLTSDPRTAATPGGGQRALIADDDPVTRKLLKIRLERLGFRVETAADGHQARARARRNPPTVVISDVLMPRLDGFRLCEALKKNRRLADIPVVLMSSAYQEAADKRLAQAVGASALVLRTPDLHFVIDAVLEALEQPRPPAPRRAGPIPRAEYVHRLIRQLERQVAQNNDLGRRLTLLEAELSLITSLQAMQTWDADALASEVLVRALDAAAVSKGAVYLLDAQGGFSLGASLGYSEAEERDLQHFFGRVDVLRACLNRGELVQVPSAEPVPGAAELLKRSKTTGLIVAPIMNAGERLGVLMAGTGASALSEEWITFIRNVGGQIGQALVVTRAFARVAAAEAQYRAIFDNALFGIFRTTAEGRIVTINRALARIAGYDSATEAMSAFHDVGPDVFVDPGRRASFMQLVTERGLVSNFESSVRRKDGSTAWVSINAQVIRDAAGTIRFIEGAVEDITERRRAEDTANALAEVSRTLSRSTDPDTVGRLATESLCRLLSAGSAALFRVEGGGSDALVLVTVAGPAPEAFKWLPRVAGARFGVAAVAVREHGPVASPDVLADSRVSYSAETRQALSEKTDRAVLAVPFFVRDQTLGALMVAARTGRVFTADEMTLAQAFADQAAQAFDTAQLIADLRSGRDFLASIAQNSADAIITTDNTGRVTYFSPGAERIFGYRADEIMGQPASRLYANGPDEASVVMRRLLAETQITEYETTLMTHDGRARDVSASISLLRDATGATTGTISVVRDMTERRRMEATLRQSEKLAAMGALLAGVAHELNNPLSIIAGHTQILKQSSLEPRVSERAGKIVEAVDRCARIIKNFLALARQAPPARTMVDVNRIIGEAVELLAYALRVDDVQVSFDLASELPELWADGNQLYQVVVNLVTNAQQALRDVPPPRRLTLKSRYDIETCAVRLEAIDNGPGIPAEIRSRIFEPFFTTKPVGKGTGLGLSLCQSMVSDHGGTIEVGGEPGQGAVFTITLPVLIPAGTAEPGELESGPSPALPRYRILVVDDETEVASLLAEMLETVGHVVDIAPDGAAALRRVFETPYDVIMSDIRMPELDGPGFYREAVRRAPEIASRFVFLTGDALGDRARTFLESVSAPRLGKPFTLEEVEAVLRTVRVPSETA